MYIALQGIQKLYFYSQFLVAYDYFLFNLLLKKKMSRHSSRTVYVGNLPGDIREREVEDLFMKVIFLFLLILIFRCFSCIWILNYGSCDGYFRVGGLYLTS